MDEDTAKLEGHIVTFNIDGMQIAGITDSSGIAEVLTPRTLTPGTQTIDVIFNEDPYYLESAVQSTIMVSNSIGKVTGDGTYEGEERRFTTTTYKPPEVTTQLAEEGTNNSIVLKGSLYDLGTAATVMGSLEWGETKGGPYLNQTDPQEMMSTGSFSAAIANLTAGTTYYYRAKAVGDGTDYGVEGRFTTSYISVSRITIIPQGQILAGQSITIAVEVTNTGGPGSYRVTLQINGTEEDAEKVTLDSGETETISFTYSENAAGTYEVEVGGVTASFEVILPAAINWLLIWIIIGVAAMILVAIYFFTRRRSVVAV